MPADREDVINDIRAVLISTSGGISESCLSRDYRSLIGRDIPFRDLGFNSLISFLRSIQGLRIVGGSTGCIITAVPDEKTGHISSLVARTRSKKSKGSSRSRRGAPSIRRAPPPRLPPTYQRTVPPRFTQQHVVGKSNSYPEIIPQRQPLQSVQSRLNISSSDTRQTTSQTASQIPPLSPSLSDSSSNSGLSPSSLISRPPSTDARLDLPRARANIVTWLRGPVFSSQGRLSNSPQTPNNGRTTAQPYLPAPSPPVFAPRMPVPVQMPTPQQVPVVQSAAYVPNKPRMRLVEQKVNNVISHVQELEAMSLRLGLGIPIYKELQRSPSNEKPVYIGVVRVGDDKFTSYPEELSSKDQAREFVARLACENLRSRPTTYGSNAYDEYVIVERVKQIVGCKSNGLFNKAVEEAYKREHGHDLPANWLEFLNTCNALSVERYNERNVIIYPVTETVRPSVEAEITNSSSSRQTEAKSIPNGSSIQHCKATSTTNGPSIQCRESALVTNGSSIHLGEETSNGSCSVLPKLTYPSENFWEVFITSASLNDIWLRLIGDEYDTKYNEALNDMEVKLMSSSGQIVSHPIVNNYYMVKFDNCWSRVQLLEIPPASDSEATAEVFLIDNGEVDTIKLTDLRELDDFVRNVPAQAVQCRLACVDMEARPVQDFLLESVIGNSFYASVIQRPTDDNDNVATIFLYEGSDGGSENTDININSVLCDKVISEIQAPRLPQKGKIAEMFVSHVEERSIFVQLKSRNLDLLNFILADISLKDLVEDFGLNAHPTIRHMDNPGAMFLVHSRKAPKQWRRGIIVGVENKRPNVHFVDYGYTENVMVSDMFDLEKVFSPLCNFPPQAIKVELSQISSNDLVGGVVGRVRELAPPTLPLLGKVTETDRPAVELFKRVQPDNLIVSINTDLSFNLTELQSAPFFDKEAKAPEVHRVDALLKIGVSKQRTSPPVASPPIAFPSMANGGKEKETSCAPILLEPYAVPDGDDFFDVFVTMSPNPSHFIVQPLNIVNSTFSAMMKEVQQFYSSQETVLPVPSDDELIEGAAFAAKHPDDLQWYRVKLLAKINSSVVTVHYLDYGDVGVINVDRIRFLDRRFRILQCLAVRAKLHGVLPINGDWTVAECLSFSELINNKPFVSKIIEKNPDSSSNEWEVSLQLLDTSGATDVDVAEKLIEEGLAARA